MNNILSWLPVIFYCANFYRMIGKSPLPYMISLVACGTVGLVKMIVDKSLNRNLLISFFVFYVITSILAWLTNGNVTPEDIIINMLFYGMFVLMLSCPVNYFQGFVAFYSTAFFFLSSFLSGLVIFQLLTSSGNYVSVLLILSVAIYYMGMYNSKRTFCFYDILPALICLLISLLAGGRGGILSTSFLLVLIIYCYTKRINKGNNRFKNIMILLLLSSTLVYIFLMTDIMDEFLTFRKFESKGMESERIGIWSRYISKCGESIIYFLFGASLEEISVIRSLGMNCHNSFIQLHAYNGIIMFISFLIILTKSVLYYFRHKKSILLIVILTIVIRGMTDKFIFGQYGMPIMMYLTFLPFAYNKVLNTSLK